MASVCIMFAILLSALAVDSRAVLSNWTENLEEYDDDNVFFEGDIILPRHLVERAVNKGSINITETTDQNKTDGNMESITASLFMRWPGAVVPYVIDSKLKCSGITCWWTNPEKHIKRAMAAWSKDTCITFRKKKATDRNYVHFVNSKMGNCASHVGRTGGRQNLYLGLGCRSDGTIIHEIGHALGFFHEQSRPDRDKYIKVNYKNINQKYWQNFEKYTTGISDMGTPYDYNSIMHYGPKAFVKTMKSLFYKTIEPLQSGVKIGQREGLSPLDIKEANLYYKC